MNIASQQLTMSMDRSQKHEFAQLKNLSQDDKKIKKVAQEFESLFIEMMFKEMKKTLNNTNIAGTDAPGKDIFNDMLYSEYAKATAKGQSFGLAKTIEDSLKINGSNISK